MENELNTADLSTHKSPRADTDTVRALLHETAINAKESLRADRVSIFLFDRERCELWSVVSQEKKIMRLDARLGVAGHVARTGETINIADAYEHPLFYKEMDIETGYRTRSLLAVPLRNRHGEIIGVGEAINKASGLFTADDAATLRALTARIADAIETAQFIKQLRGELPTRMAENNLPGFSTQKIVGMSHKMEAIIRLIDQIRDCSVDVLIQGESGTGKELVARALHYNSPRANGPFVALNCAALPDNLVEAELFGIEKGVATGVDRRIGKFEAANRGTLFLDEIGDLSLAAQAKLLRALQERAVDRVGNTKPIPVDIRIIAATNRDLLGAIREKQFREDLYYRVRVIRVQTPPLREITEDIPLLANHFLEKHCLAMNVELKSITPAALQCLMRYTWPGNNRQLENEIKRLIAFVRGKSIIEEHLDPSIRNLDTPAPAGQESKEPALGPPPTPTLPEAIDALERRMIEDALRKSAGNKQKAAQALGLSRQGLIKKLKRLAISSY